MYPMRHSEDAVTRPQTDIPTTVKNQDLVERRRRQIVMAGIKLFSRKGFHKTTLKELAEEAGLSHGNIYDYVGSKEDIFFLIHDFLATLAMDILNRSTEDVQDPIEKLRRMVRGEFNLMDQWADALLLIYQESHILSGDFLRRLLEKERAHVEKFETVIADGIADGSLRSGNVRLTANLIKAMIDAWTIKRWDLRSHVSQRETEGAILDLALNGILTETVKPPTSVETPEPLGGKTALVVNGGTVLGQGACTALLARGARVVAQLQDPISLSPFPVCAGDDERRLTVIETGSATCLERSVLDGIEATHGPIDIYVHDLGIGTTQPPADTDASESRRRLEANLGCAQELSDDIMQRMAARATGRIVYLAPWAWDKFAAPIRFETVRAGTIALARAVSGALAPVGVNVNCIVPGYIRAVRPLEIEKSLSRELTGTIPSGRLGEIYDITDAMLFLIGDASKYMTGQTLTITGGMG